MEVAARATAADVGAAPLVARAPRYDFYQLVELLMRAQGCRPEDEGKAPLQVAGVRFKSSASLGFPGTDVVALHACPREGHVVEVSFLGLHGAQSPLPGYYLEQLGHASAHGEGAAVDLLDFFHHRLLTLLHLTWRKYRHYVRYEDGARDGFSKALFALTGLADEDLRADSAINWGKMLAYVGLVAGRSRSSEVVSGVLAHYFDLEEVEVLPWQERWVAVPGDQRSRCGTACMGLGRDFVIGERVVDITGKFLVRIGRLTRQRMADFLPDGRDGAALQAVVDFLLRDPLAYDLELELLPDQVQPLRLSARHPERLGWTSFLDPTTDAMRRHRRVRLQIRE
ncbi:type VI secretion system protein ImpH [Alkalispirillum mobile]|uniref:Type VI secretion system protein ImpH n=1 Tax=Alkalispirillum mobile TaxID=85925 RepID=A0A498CH81_9GAMM|nr:type VI secretion system baseplate subunit TssG [Alkalispirillum mobile]RLK51711.1 type VI secretion system protein ImpH [Alkalispirillum mobile]